MTNDKPDFAVEFYWKMRNAVTGRLSRDAKRMAEREARATSKPFDKGRDIVAAGSALDSDAIAFCSGPHQFVAAAR